MKLPALLLLLLPLLAWMGCGEDDDNPGPTATATLNYDGDNITAPALPEGRNQFAVYFPPTETAPFAGRNLEGVRFYLTSIPQSTTVVVYDEGADNRTPGPELYRRDITNRVRTTGWIDDRIIPGISIESGRGIWLVVEVELAANLGQSVGCDAGANYDPNGNLLSLSVRPAYLPFDDDVNWNIRGLISAE
jgi:hypothetical protein